MISRFVPVYLISALICCSQLLAANAPATKPQGEISGPAPYLLKDDGWFKSDDAKTIAAHVLSWQSPLGGWPKNLDTTASMHPAGQNDLDAYQTNHPTFDNLATTGEMRFMARMFIATGDPIYKDSFARGLEYIFKAQYPSGGWPQFYPPDDKYHRYITFNDYAMTRLMDFLRAIYTTDSFPFVSPADKQRSHESFDRGVDCILKCQIKLHDKLTAWCAQHDPVTYEPRVGRSFELPSISGAESVGVVETLMSIDHPSPAVVNSIESAVAWFKSATLHGIRVDAVPDPKGPRGMNRVIVKDPNAPPIWARFYDLTDGEPLYSDRDGVAKSNIADISYERRNDYRWLFDWPKTLLDKEYPKWKNRPDVQILSPAK